MIYFYYGEDRDKVYKKAKGVFEALKSKKPDATFVSFNEENLSQSEIQSIINSQGLFERKIVARVSDILGNSELAKEMITFIESLASSENIVIWSESNGTKINLDKIKKYAEKSEEFSNKIENKNSFNIFSISDAIGNRDKKKFWNLILEAIRNGVSPEEIHGTIWWQIKVIIISTKTDSAEEAQLKPFVYSNARKFSKNWASEDLRSVSQRLVSMYHMSHLGECDLNIELEKLALSI